MSSLEGRHHDGSCLRFCGTARYSRLLAVCRSDATRQVLAQRSTGGEVAIKRITVASEDAAMLALREASVMQRLQHDKIVRFATCV